MSDGGDGADRARRGREPGEVALVVVCIVGLVLGGVLAPASSADNSAGGPEVDLSGLLSEVLELFGPGEPGEFPRQDGCVVALLDRPVPGSTVRVKVYEDREPAAQRTVWFNDEVVGRTDRRGLVTGQVPYDEELEVRVSNPEGGECQFVAPEDVPRRVRYGNRPDDDRGPGDDDRGPGDDESGPDDEDETPGPTERLVDAHDRSGEPAGTESGGFEPVDGQAGSPSGAALSPVGAAVAPLAPPRQTADGSSQRENFSVEDRTRVRVLDRPVPGAVVTVEPVIGGVPMANATLSVDGEVVGRTNAAGRYDLQIPRDDTQRLQIEATRGDFTARGTIKVLHLSVAIRPGGLPAVPGQDATVLVTRGERRVQNAPVTADGRSLGRTNESGVVAYQLPGDPTATVTAEYDGEQATAAVWPLYAGTLFVVALFLGLLAAFVSASVTVGYRLAGLRGVAVAIGGWLAVGVVVVASVLAGETGFAVAALAIAVVALLVVAVVYRKQLVAATDDVSVSTTRSWLVGLALRASAALDSTLSWLLRVCTDFRGALGALPGWLRRAGRTLLARLRAVPGRLRGLAGTRRGKVAGAVFAGGLFFVGVLAASYALYGLPGLGGVLAALIVVGLAALAWWLWPEFDDQDDEVEIEETTSADASTPEPPTGAAWLRGVWRQFARRVAPDSWRTSTPGEISRRALSLGLPRDPVLELTQVFRDVEYGGRSLSEARRELAATAVDALEDQLPGQDGETE